MATITTKRGPDLYDEVVNVLEASLDLPEREQFWDQGSWRSPFLKPRWQGQSDPYSWVADRGRCGTRMCMAGTTCDITGGRWLITLTPEGPRLPDGKLLSVSDAMGHLEFLLAEPSDNPAAVGTDWDYRIIHAEERASRLLELAPHNTPFYLGLGNRQSEGAAREFVKYLREMRSRFYEHRS